MSVYGEDLISTVLVDSGFRTGFNENLVSTESMTAFTEHSVSTVLVDGWFTFHLPFL